MKNNLIFYYSDPPPPILERVTDVAEVPLPKIKWSRLDAPPTLTPHKPPENVVLSNQASFKLNLVKLPATKDQKRRWSVDSPSARVSTETQHAGTYSFFKANFQFIPSAS